MRVRVRVHTCVTNEEDAEDVLAGKRWETRWTRVSPDAGVGVVQRRTRGPAPSPRGAPRPGSPSRTQTLPAPQKRRRGKGVRRALRTFAGSRVFPAREFTAL